jgi:ribosomal protein S27E
MPACHRAPVIDDADGPDAATESFRWMSTDCPGCGARLRPLSTPSGNVYLRCGSCGITVI